MRVRRCRIHIMRASVSGLMALLVLWFFVLNIFIHSCDQKTRAHQFCDIDFISEIPLNGKIKHLSKYWRRRQYRTTPAGQILGGRDPCNPCGVDAYGCVGSAVLASLSAAHAVS